MSLDDKIGGKKRAKSAGTTKGVLEREKSQREPKRQKETKQQNAGEPRVKKSDRRNEKGPGVIWSNILVVLMIALMVVTVVKSVGIAGDIMDVATACENSQGILEDSKRLAKDAELVFVSERSFEVPYGNIDEVLGLLEGVSGIAVNSVVAVDPKQGFAEVGTQADVATYGAARLTLTVADVTTALKSLDKAQLALNTLEVSGNTVTLDIVLKGVESW